MWKWVDQCALTPANHSAPYVKEEGAPWTASWNVYKKTTLWGRPMPFHDSLLIFNYFFTDCTWQCHELLPLTSSYKVHLHSLLHTESPVKSEHDSTSIIFMALFGPNICKTTRVHWTWRANCTQKTQVAHHIIYFFPLGSQVDGSDVENSSATLGLKAWNVSSDTKLTTLVKSSSFKFSQCAGAERKLVEVQVISHNPKLCKIIHLLSTL